MMPALCGRITQDVCCLWKNYSRCLVSVEELLMMSPVCGRITQDVCSLWKNYSWCLLSVGELLRMSALCGRITHDVCSLWENYSWCLLSAGELLMVSALSGRITYDIGSLRKKVFLFCTVVFSFISCNFNLVFTVVWWNGSPLKVHRLIASIIQWTANNNRVHHQWLVL